MTANKLTAELKIPALAEMISIVRLTLSSFASTMKFSNEAIEDMKIAVSEAFTNVVQYAYTKKSSGDLIKINFTQKKEGLEVIIKDSGCGFNTKKPPQRDLHDEDIHMGLGIVFMNNLMDKVEIKSIKNKGTTVKLFKKL